MLRVDTIPRLRAEGVSRPLARFWVCYIPS